MKKITICALLLTFSCSSFCQSTEPSTTFTQAEYLEKSKQQKRIATTLMISGVSSVVIMPLLWYITKKDDNGFNVFMGIFIAGAIAIPASIPFYINAGKYKRKAKLGMKGEHSSFMNNTQHENHFPAIAFRLSL